MDSRDYVAPDIYYVIYGVTRLHWYKSNIDSRWLTRAYVLMEKLSLGVSFFSYWIFYFVELYFIQREKLDLESIAARVV